MKRLVLLGVSVIFFWASVGASTAVAADKLIFKKVDFFITQGDEEKKQDARLELDPIAQLVTLADERNGTRKWAVIPYSQITNIVYERSSHRRYTAGVLVSPFLWFSKGKKHWLTIEFDDVADQPQGYVYARLDKKNYRRIMAALEAATGLESKRRQALKLKRLLRNSFNFLRAPVSFTVLSYRRDRACGVRDLSNV